MRLKFQILHFCKRAVFIFLGGLNLLVVANFNGHTFTYKMENWQSMHIRQHKLELLRLTKVTLELLAVLEKEHILVQDDVEHIVSNFIIMLLPKCIYLSGIKERSNNRKSSIIRLQ